MLPRLIGIVKRNLSGAKRRRDVRGEDWGERAHRLAGVASNGMGQLPVLELFPPPTAEERAQLDAKHIEICGREHAGCARPCPRCGTPPEHLEWYRWESGGESGGYEGVATRCKFCLAEVDSFAGMHWTGIGRRRRRNTGSATVQ